MWLQPQLWVHLLPWSRSRELEYSGDMCGFGCGREGGRVRLCASDGSLCCKWKLAKVSRRKAVLAAAFVNGLSVQGMNRNKKRCFGSIADRIKRTSCNAHYTQLKEFPMYSSFQSWCLLGRSCGRRAFGAASVGRSQIACATRHRHQWSGSLSSIASGAGSNTSIVCSCSHI